MNEGQTEHLQNDNDFNIVMTDNPDEFVLKQFFEHLGRDSVATRNAKLSNLASML